MSSWVAWTAQVWLHCVVQAENYCIALTSACKVQLQTIILTNMVCTSVLTMVSLTSAATTAATSSVLVQLSVVSLLLAARKVDAVKCYECLPVGPWMSGRTERAAGETCLTVDDGTKGGEYVHCTGSRPIELHCIGRHGEHSKLKSKAKYSNW